MMPRARQPTIAIDLRLAGAPGREAIEARCDGEEFVKRHVLEIRAG
jgi:hypothetical protein